MEFLKIGDKSLLYPIIQGGMGVGISLSSNVAKEGDIVRIMETRPLSATKRFRLVEVVEEAVII